LSHNIVRRPNGISGIASLLLVAAVGLLWEVRQERNIESAMLAQATAADAVTQEQSWPPRSEAHGHYFYASPKGTATNPGSQTRPLDLATALSASGPVRPGDVVWLRGGVYNGAFHSELTGKPGAFIVVAQYPGERAVLDGASIPNQPPVLRVDGAYTVYWGFEVTNSSPHEADLARGAGVDVFGAYTKFINLVVHDTGNGFGVWTPALGAEVYGNLIFESGWDSEDRGHGHSIYVQNDTPAKRIVDNILFDGHSFGIHGYTEAGQIDNLHLEGNISFNHGTRARNSGPKANILVGGRKVAKSPVLVSNYGYYPEGSTGRDADLGYIAGCADAALTDNYFAGGVPVLLTHCTGARMQGNTLIGAVDGLLPAQFPHNSYLSTKPTESKVFVRANRYQRGRAQIAIFNWERRPSVQIDLSRTGLRQGERFEIRDVRNFFGEPLAAGAFEQRPIDLPLGKMRWPVEAGAESGAGGIPEFGAAVVVPASWSLTKGPPWARP
jgi:hypothetical protein